MTDYHKALADARDALAIYRRYGAPLCGYATNAVDALEDLLAAIAAQTAPLADHEPIPCGPRGYEGSLYVAAHEGNPYWTETPGGYNLERCPRAVYDALLAHAKDHPCPAP